MFTSLKWLRVFDLTLHYRVSARCSSTCNISAPFLAASSSPPLLPFLFSSSPLLSTRLAPFYLTVRRYLKDQITMATISHIVIAHTGVWWLFLFWRVCRCAFTSLADRQVTCSWEEGTTLPSVGPMCLHTVTDSPKHPALPWWLMTVSHMPIETFGPSQAQYGKFKTHACHMSLFEKVNMHHSSFWYEVGYSVTVVWYKPDSDLSMSGLIAAPLIKIFRHTARTYIYSSVHAILKISKWKRVLSCSSLPTNVRDNILHEILAEKYPWKLGSVLLLRRC